MADDGGNRLSWNQFQSANKGKWSRDEMSRQWALYKAGPTPNAAAPTSATAAPAVPAPVAASSSTTTAATGPLHEVDAGRGSPRPSPTSSLTAANTSAVTTTHLTVPLPTWNEFQSLAKGLGWSRDRMSAEWAACKDRGRLPDELMQRIAGRPLQPPNNNHIVQRRSDNAAVTKQGLDVGDEGNVLHGNIMPHQATSAAQATLVPRGTPSRQNPHDDPQNQQSTSSSTHLPQSRLQSPSQPQPQSPHLEQLQARLAVAANAAAAEAAAAAAHAEAMAAVAHAAVTSQAPPNGSHVTASSGRPPLPPAIPHSMTHPAEAPLQQRQPPTTSHQLDPSKDRNALQAFIKTVKKAFGGRKPVPRRPLDGGSDSRIGGGAGGGVLVTGPQRPTSATTPAQQPHARAVATLAASAVLVAGLPAAGSAGLPASYPPLPPTSQITKTQLQAQPSSSSANNAFQLLQSPSVTTTASYTSASLLHSSAHPATHAPFPPNLPSHNGATSSDRYSVSEQKGLSNNLEPVSRPAKPAHGKAGSGAGQGGQGRAADVWQGTAGVSVGPRRSTGQQSLRQSLSTLGKKLRDSFSAPSSPTHRATGSGHDNHNNNSSSAGLELAAKHSQHGTGSSSTSLGRMATLRQSAGDMWDRVKHPGDRTGARRAEKAAQRAAKAQAPHAFILALPLYDLPGLLRAPPREHVPHTETRFFFGWSPWLHVTVVGNRAVRNAVPKTPGLYEWAVLPPGANISDPLQPIAMYLGKAGRLIDSKESLRSRFLKYLPGPGGNWLGPKQEQDKYLFWKEFQRRGFALLYRWLECEDREPKALETPWIGLQTNKKTRADAISCFLGARRSQTIL